MYVKIRKALQKDDVEKVKELLQSDGGTNLNAYDKEGFTILLLSIDMGSIKCATYLINETDIDVFLPVKKKKENALMKCMKSGIDMLDVARLLLNKKINIEERNELGKTCLHIASELNFVKGIEFLLRNNADINALDKEKNTPLMSAIKYRCEEAAFCLIENNANVNIKDKYDDSVLHIGVKEHMPNIIKAILSTEKVNVKYCIDKNGNTPLHVAAEENIKTLCDLFLAHHFNPSHRNKKKETYMDILEMNEKKKILEKEEKQKNNEEKILRKRKKMEEAMERTPVSQFLKQYNLESLIPTFYNHKYFFLNSSFLCIQEEKLKQMHLDKEHIFILYDSIRKYKKEQMEQSLEYQIRNRRLMEEQARNKNLKIASFAFSIIFTSLFIYSVSVSLYYKLKHYF